MDLQIFSQLDFLPALKAFFKNLKVPMNYIADEPTTAKEILKDTYKQNDAFQLMDDVYFVGMVDDAAFEGNKSLKAEKIKSDYDGILIFGISLKERPNGLLPTRSQLAEISRAFNREFYYTPVVVVFKYGNLLAFANTERLKYKQEWREGEKAGKVSLLRDIDIEKPHSGHERILVELQIPTSGKNEVDSFTKLYYHWQEVFNVSILNKKFYLELSNWYFWAVKNVTFPNEPTSTEASIKKVDLDDLVQEHKATNVIRMLTRLLFVWFIKEKKLIPEELFDINALQKDILSDISPYHEEGTLFAQANRASIYYKAILQNLFFATLNCPIQEDGSDKRSRRFRLNNHYGQDRGNDWMYRYEEYFKNPNAFLKLMNSSVPFLNGGLFECLDIKQNHNLYIDGFSDQMPKGEQLVVPDYLFFGVEEEVDLSTEYGINNKGTKQAAVKGLINILKSYKFTITENTPIEEDVALDPELLGKVFENLLASYNPETKTTARKQTGSFYTPREIVNYMVDESLIAHLKNSVTNWNIEETSLDEKLHELTSFDPGNPFEGNTDLTKSIVKALNECKILDPACGSGAFPMGILQKMVHMLQKLDPDNELWKAVQIEKTEMELKNTLTIEDKKEREEKLKEINEAFDQRMNDPDYARKLYLIENCIYGVDIQPIASQISKLRFFISLVVDQKPTDNVSKNFGIRPLPNLETKFVTANTLIGIEKPKAQTTLFDTKEIKLLETELKKVRHKLFGARTKDTKLKYRQKDEELRSQIAEELKKTGWQNDAAEKLAGWDPYDQNASSPFFDPEWMFDISEGFDVVIGNPPYGNIFKDKKMFNKINKSYKTAEYKVEAYAVFIEAGTHLLSKTGLLTFITPYTFLSGTYFSRLRKFIRTNSIERLTVLGKKVFEAAEVDTCISVIRKTSTSELVSILDLRKVDAIGLLSASVPIKIPKSLLLKSYEEVICVGSELEIAIFQDLNSQFGKLENAIEFYHGIQSRGNNVAITDTTNQYSSPLIIMCRDFHRYSLSTSLKYFTLKPENIKSGGDLKYHHTSPKIIIRTTADGIVASLDYRKSLVLNSVNIAILKARGNYFLESILGFLNSSLVDFWYQLAVQEPGKTFAEVKIVYMKRIPLPTFSSIGNILVKELVQILLFLNDRKSKFYGIFYSTIDSLVFNLYFANHMKKREIDVLEFVERDMKKALLGRDFASLGNAEKEKVIEQLHAKWSHPDNEVRNRIKLFAVRSPEILKPILES